MSFLADFRERWRALVLRGRVERELDEELRDHLERDVAARVRAGNDPVSARREALLALGGIEQVKEEVRDARGTRPLEEFGSDLRYALRSLRRRPGFTLTVVLVLGIALGAATAILSGVRVAFFAALPYPRADRLVRIYEQNSPTNRWSLSTVDVQGVHAHARSLAVFGQVQAGEAALSGAGTPVRVKVGRASAGFFQALEVPVVAGRSLEPGDEAPEAQPVAVMSYRMAAELFGSPTAALSRAVTIDGISHTIVGVLPPGRERLAGVTGVVWPALRLTPPTRRGPFWLQGVGRLRDGVRLDDVRADLTAVSRTIFPEWASSFRDSSAVLTPVPLREAILGQGGRSLTLLSIAAILVLLAAVANVATLLLVRALSREQELAVRAALGAGRGRVARLVALEGLVLVAAAGVVALGVAALAIKSGFAVPDSVRLPRDIDLMPALGLGAGVSLLAGLAVVWAPVWSVLARARRGRLSGSRRGGASRHTVRLRTALVGLEFALALPLMLGAGLLLNSFLRLQRVDPGYVAEGVMSASIALPRSRYPDFTDTEAFWRSLESGMNEVSGIDAAGLAAALPPDDPGDINNFDLVDRPVPAGSAEPVAPWAVVSAGYFRVLDIPLLEGRLFTAADSGNAPPVVVVSRAWADRYFPGGSAVGRELIAGGCTTCPHTTVVGVVGNVKYLGLAGGGEAVYAPLGQSGANRLYLVARGRLPERELGAALMRETSRLDPELPVTPVSLTRQLRSSLADPKRWALTVGAFALTTVMLAALGVFGLMSFLVRERRQEIGVRLALGAEPGAVVRLILGQGMVVALAGVAVGIVAAGVSGRWIEQLLFGVRAFDPVTVGLVMTVLLAIAAFSSWIPARIAAAIRPTEALAAE